MAATKLAFAQQGVVAPETRANLLDKSMDLLLRRTDNKPRQLEKYFRHETAKGATFKMVTWSNILNTPRKNNDQDDLPYEEPVDGYGKTITIPTYRNAIRITRSMGEEDQSGKAMSLMSGLLDSGVRFQELMFAYVFNTCTTTAGADGSFICATDHYHEDPAGGTWSNVETAGAFAPTTVNAMRVSMRKRKNEKGFVSPIKLTKLLVPPDLEEAARKYNLSEEVYDLSTNAANPWKGQEFEVIDNLTNSTAFYGWGDLPEEMWGLHMVILAAPNVASLTFENIDIVAGYRIRFRMAAGASQAKNLHRNAGA